MDNQCTTYITLINCIQSLNALMTWLYTVKFRNTLIRPHKLKSFSSLLTVFRYCSFCTISGCVCMGLFNNIQNLLLQITLLSISYGVVIIVTVIIIHIATGNPLANFW